jgi:hypothetical protein
MKVALTVVKGPGSGLLMEFVEPRAFIIGRSTEADFQLPPGDPYASRRHVYLEICPPACRLRNLNSTNPPHVNGESISGERELRDGDVIELGYTQLKVEITDQVPTRRSQCRTCGRSIELLPDEQESGLCWSCSNKASQPRSPKPLQEILTRCYVCGSDLSKRANSDGRAAELADIAIYACEHCLPPGDDHAGRVIHGYVLRRSLGAGGMGAVFLAHHQATARLVALKQVKDLKNAQLIKRFEREAKLLNGIAHENVVRYLDAGADAEGGPFLVTEYVPDGDTEQLLMSNGRPLRSSDAVQIIIGVLAGLGHLHSQTIIHRDIKPQNILLRRASHISGGSWFIPKLADFGLAKSYARAGGTRITKAGTFLGTLMFMPPEQVVDPRSVREAADVYAVGVSLYYLLTLQYSFDFPTPADVARFQQQRPEMRGNPHLALEALMQLRHIRHPFLVILEGKPVPIQNRNSPVPRRLAEVVDKAVRKEASERFQSAAEFCQALEHALG